MRHGRWKVGARVGAVLAGAVLAGAVLAGTTGTAAAEPGLTTWTTYLYQGPGSHYSVADEINQLQPIDILGCAKGWCQVVYEGRTGYVLAEVVVRRGEDPANPPPGVLAQPAAALEPAPKGPCFTANQMGGNGGYDLTRFCQK